MLLACIIACVGMYIYLYTDINLVDDIEGFLRANDIQVESFGGWDILIKILGPILFSVFFPLMISLFHSLDDFGENASTTEIYCFNLL